MKKPSLSTPRFVELLQSDKLLQDVRVSTSEVSRDNRLPAGNWLQHARNTLRDPIRVFAYVLLASLWACSANAVSFDWAIIGNPGNAADSEIMTSDGTTGYGSVSYAYRISRHEVTNAQYTEFLNAVAATDANALYSTNMNTDPRAGIIRSGSPGSYTYAVKPDAVGQGPSGTDYAYGDKPVIYVSFLDAMRFVNWLNNGEPIGAQGPLTTEQGVYSVSDGTSEVRSANATYFIPSEDEWYKAAYFDPSSGFYFDYPTSTDTVPNNNLPSGDTGNSANFFDGGFTTGNTSYSLTEVGAYALSASPYGTFDQGGNVSEWNEELTSLRDGRVFVRGVRDGSWGAASHNLLSSSRTQASPAGQNNSLGFRVAARIPEPTSSALALAAICLLGSSRHIDNPCRSYPGLWL